MPCLSLLKSVFSRKPRATKSTVQPTLEPDPHSGTASSDKEVNPDTQLAKLAEENAMLVSANKELTSTITMMQLEMAQERHVRRSLMMRNYNLHIKLAEKDNLTRSMVIRQQIEMDQQRNEHESELRRIRDNHDATAAMYDELIKKMVEDQNQSIMNLRDTENAYHKLRDTADAYYDLNKQLDTRLADCNAKLLEMKTIKDHLEQALLEQKQTSNVNFEDLTDSPNTTSKMSAFHSTLLQKRDDQIVALQHRIDQLEKACGKDISQVAPNYYKLLGVERNVKTSDLKKAYQTKCLMHHPDKHRDSPECSNHEAIFKTLKFGYEILNNPPSRTVYDQWLDMEEVQCAHYDHYCL